MNARSRLRTIVLLLVVGFLLLPGTGLAAQARNIILMIGDGMGPSHLGAAWLYSNRILGKELRMVEVMKSGRTAYVVNDTADAIVTESAAAATQIASGGKVTARAVGMALIGHSKDSKEYVGIHLSAIQKAQTSMELIVDELGKSPTPEKIREAVKRHLAIEITEDEAKVVADDTIRKLDPKNYSYATLHSLAFVLRPYLRVGWASQTHTASPLFAFGTGPGSE